jgi:hypothetical protein
MNNGGGEKEEMVGMDGSKEISWRRSSCDGLSLCMLCLSLSCAILLHTKCFFISCFRSVFFFFVYLCCCGQKEEEQRTRTSRSYLLPPFLSLIHFGVFCIGTMQWSCGYNCSGFGYTRSFSSQQNSMWLLSLEVVFSA